MRAQAAQEAQMQRGAVNKWNSELAQNLAIRGGNVGDPLAYQVANPDGTPQKQEMWDMGLDYGDTMTQRPSSVINKSRPITQSDIYNNAMLYSKAHGTNMPGASALAKMLGAGDAPDEWVETPYNALSSQGGLGYDKKST